MEKAHAVIPIEMYDELKRNKEKADELRKELADQIEVSRRMGKAIIILTSQDATRIHFIPEEVLNKCGLNIKRGQRVDGTDSKIELID